MRKYALLCLGERPLGTKVEAALGGFDYETVKAGGGEPHFFRLLWDTNCAMGILAYSGNSTAHTLLQLREEGCNTPILVLYQRGRVPEDRLHRLPFVRILPESVDHSAIHTVLSDLLAVWEEAYSIWRDS